MPAPAVAAGALRSRTVAPWLGVLLGCLAAVFMVLVIGVAGAIFGLHAPSIGSYRPSGAARAGIPSLYLRLYQAAAKRYGIDPWILAGIGSVETNHGRSPQPGVRSGVNSFGCCAGPMQFNVRNGPPSTWDTYGVDGSGDGVRSPYDPEDAIPAAARYLKAAGAPGDYHGALLTYNNAEWYVNEVVAKASEYRAAPAIAAGPRLAAVISLATEIEQRQIPYCYGGGHLTPAAPTPGGYCWTGDGRKTYGITESGLDCSSSVSLLLQHVGYQLPTLTSGELAGWGDPGPGRYVTIWANPTHVYLQIDDRFWGTSASNYRHGPGWHAARPPAGFTPRHPPGL